MKPKIFLVAFEIIFSLTILKSQNVNITVNGPACAGVARNFIVKSLSSQVAKMTFTVTGRIGPNNSPIGTICTSCTSGTEYCISVTYNSLPSAFRVNLFDAQGASLGTETLVEYVVLPSSGLYLEGAYVGVGSRHVISANISNASQYANFTYNWTINSVAVTNNTHTLNITKTINTPVRNFSVVVTDQCNNVQTADIDY